MLAHCPPCSKWGPGSSTGEIAYTLPYKPTLPYNKANGSGQVSSLTITPQCIDHIWDLPLPLPNCKLGKCKMIHLGHHQFTLMQH